MMRLKRLLSTNQLFKEENETERAHNALYLKTGMLQTVNVFIWCFA